jgi:hypothetical protein
MTKIKRTAKWMKYLTIAELRHMKDWQKSLTLKSFVVNREYQTKSNGIICWECKTIEKKLLKAGVRLPFSLT